MSRIGVIGAGLMGSGIAEVTARAGVDVVVCERDRAASVRGRERIEHSIQRAVARGKLAEDEAQRAIDSIRHTADIGACADRQLVVEAVLEDQAAKVAIFGELDRVVESPDAVLATNTSSIPIMKLAMVTGRPQQVVGIHFFNPVPVLRLVELVTSLHTSAETVAVAESFARDTLGKRVVKSPDRAGFVVNALLIPYLLSAVRMLESGFATPQDIDDGMVEGCAHPMGPLALLDLIGLDTATAVADSLFEEFKEPLYAPPPLLNRMVEAGLLGRKTGRGFFTYDD